MKDTIARLQPGMYYHIYNRGNNRENLFLENRNYSYFLSLYEKHIGPIADTYAYCLMRNHFHFSVRMKETSQVLQTSQGSKTCDVYSRGFSNFFNAYAKAINKGYGRTGSLFEERFGRIPVTGTSYFKSLIFYIHFNPQKHSFVNDFRDWPWSSYCILTSNIPTILKRDEVLQVFGGIQGFEKFHRGMVHEKKLAQCIDKEFDMGTDLTSLKDL